MTTQLQEPVAARSGASIHSTEEDEFAQQQVENPLEITPSIQPTPSIMERQDPMESIHGKHDIDEPPPPYSELAEELHGTPADAPQIAPIEYSVDNSPQLLVHPDPAFPEVPPRNPARLSSQFADVSLTQSPASPGDSTLVPAPLQVRSPSPNESASQRSVRPETAHTTSTFSSAKAREAGFEIEEPTPPIRTGSSSSFPSISLLSSSETLRHTREPGKLKAYLIPFPKPRLKNIKPEDIPDRFVIYTPPLPPLSKPAPGEKESQWHKTQRLWQEDIRKAMISNASRASWKGMKARTTSLIHRGVNLTRSSNVEFLDRVSGGAIASTTQDANEQEGATQITDAPLSSEPVSTSPSEASVPTLSSVRSSSTASVEKQSGEKQSVEKQPKPEALEELTLIFPPSLPLGPEAIRTEFVDTLMRTREKSRNQAVVASALLPFAAAVDASLIITFGSLTQISSVWAYTSTRGAMTSRRMTKGLARGEQQTHDHELHETETRGCTCGHHHDDFGSPATIAKPDKKGKKKGINMQLQKSTHMEILRRYLELACLKQDFNMFPQIEEAAGDVNEGSVLEAIGWRPVRRYGRDLEVEFKDRVEKYTPEEDEAYQTREAKEDIKRVMKKASNEWVTWCKSFQKDFQKDPEGAVKK